MDMLRLKKYFLSDSDDVISVKEADINSDGKISLIDLLNLSKYLLCKTESLTQSAEAVDFESDADGDGLIGWDEILFTGTDPNDPYSVDSNINDGQADSDNDSITNYDELYKYFTDPLNPDSDNDGISDYDEINGTSGYKTSPVLSDTDNDGLSDYEELELKLDPTKKSSDGKTDDSDRIFTQTINYDNKILSSINSDLEYQLSVQADVSGYLENEITVKESVFSNTIDYDAVYGKKIDISLDDNCNLGTDSLKISFKLSDKNIDDYMVFKYFDNLNMIFPMPTTYNKENNEICCTDDQGGTYCLADINKWKSFVVSKPQNTPAPEKEAKTLILFCEDAVLANSNRNAYKKITSLSKSLYELFEEHDKTLYEEIGLFGYSEIQNSAVTFSTYDFYGSSYFDNYNAVDYFMGNEDFLEGFSLVKKSFISSNSISGKGSIMTSPLSMALEATKNDDFTFVYVFSLADKKYKKSNTLSENELSEIKEFGGLRASYIIPSDSSAETVEYYQSLADEFGGKVFFLDDNELTDKVSGFADDFIGYTIPLISYCNYDEYIDPSCKNDLDNNALPDNDFDGLSDAAEVNWDIYDPDNTYSDYADEKYTGTDKTKKGMEQLLGDEYVGTNKYVPFVTDPSKRDTDEDGLSDEEEIYMGTNPRSFDSDKDGLSDGIECSEWFDPLDANPDGDHYNDYEEYVNKTDPFIYNLTAKEWGMQFLEGAVKGDIIENPTVPQLVGQITLGVIPYAGVVCDVRDALVNAAYERWIFASLSAFGVIMVVGDLASGSSKIIKFIIKHMDDTDEIADLLLTLSKKFPDDFAKLVPNSSLDDIIEAFKKTNHISRNSYDEIAELFEKAGKKFPTIADDFPEARKLKGSKDLWKRGNFDRGDIIDELLGNNLGHNYPTYDHYDKTSRIATSVKSIDPMSKAYQSTSGFKNILNRYASKLTQGSEYVKFKGDKKTYQVIARKLEIVFPDVPFNNSQKTVLNSFINTAKQNYGIEVVITII